MTNSGDQVALSLNYPCEGAFWSVHKAPQINAPLSDTFYKNCIASGSITPPSGESASVRRTDYMVGLCVLCLVACGLMFAAVALFWRA